MAMHKELCYNLNIIRFYKFRMCTVEIGKNRIHGFQL